MISSISIPETQVMINASMLYDESSNYKLQTKVFHDESAFILIQYLITPIKNGISTAAIATAITSTAITTSTIIDYTDCLTVLQSKVVVIPTLTETITGSSVLFQAGMIAASLGSALFGCLASVIIFGACLIGKRKRKEFNIKNGIHNYSIVYYPH